VKAKVGEDMKNEFELCSRSL